MKKTSFTLFLFLIFLTLNSQNKALVSKVNGIEVYLLSEPVREYQLVKGS